MLLRLNWLLIMLIYLSVNGQVFATAIHICPEMSLNSKILSTSTKSVNIHEHHQKITHHKAVEYNALTHDIADTPSMNNCECVDCDCVQNVAGQANTSLIQKSDLTSYLPVIATILVKLEQNFISQHHTTPYRPPVVT